MIGQIERFATLAAERIHSGVARDPEQPGLRAQDRRGVGIARDGAGERFLYDVLAIDRGPHHAPAKGMQPWAHSRQPWFEAVAVQIAHHIPVLVRMHDELDPEKDSQAWPNPFAASIRQGEGRDLCAFDCGA